MDMSCRREDSEGFLHQMVTELCSLLENSQLSFLIRDQGMCMLSVFVKVPSTLQQPCLTNPDWSDSVGFGRAKKCPEIPKIELFWNIGMSYTVEKHF